MFADVLLMHALDEAVAIQAQKRIRRALTKAISQFCTRLGSSSNSFDTVVLSHENQHPFPGCHYLQKQIVNQRRGRIFLCIHGLCGHRDLV